MARVILTEEGEDIIVGGDDVDVIGTTAGGEEITVISGNVRLNASFTAGGDTINLPGDAEDYVVRVEGATVIFTNTVDGTTVSIPTSDQANTITFSGGADARTLVFDTVDGRFELDGQPITNVDTAVLADGVTPEAIPVANDDSFTVEEDATLSGDVGANDTDADTPADDLTFALVEGTDVAGLTFNDDGTFTLDTGDEAYADLDPGENATVTFSYTVTDPDGNSDTATVTVTVNGIDSDPVANAATDEGDEDTTISGTLADDAFDPEGQPVTFSLVGNAPPGFTLNPDGSYTLDASVAAYQPLNEGESQDVVVTYEVTDPQGNSSQSTLTITVNGSSIGTQTLLTPGIDQFTGTFDDDIFIARNNELGAGDRIDDPNGGDQDELRLFINADNNLQNYGAFILDSIENFIVTNDDSAVDGTPQSVNIDLSSSSGIENVVSLNSSAGVVFTQLTSLADVTVDNVTGDEAFVTVQYQNSLLTGATEVNLNVNDAEPSTITIGGTGTLAGRGVETINLNVEGDSTIDDLVSGSLTRLNVSGEGNITLLNLPDTLLVLDASAAVGDTVVGVGDLEDTPTIILSGSAGDTIITEDADIEDADFTNFEGVTVLDARNGSSVVLGEEANEAGIQVVNLDLGESETTFLDATDFDRSLTVNVDNGNNTVLLGAANDTVNAVNIQDSDDLNAGAGAGDVLNILTQASLSSANQVSGFELINLVATNATGDFNITLDNDNAPSVGSSLTINGADLGAGNQVFFSGIGISTYSVVVNSGAAADFIQVDNSVGGDVVNSGAGNDFVTVGATSATSNLGDTANTGDGNDYVAVFGDGDDTVNLGDAGAPTSVNPFALNTNDRVDLVGGRTTTITGGAGTQAVYDQGGFDATDSFDGGAGIDQLWIEFADDGLANDDVLFANVDNVEILGDENDGNAANFTIGANAQAAGINTIALAGSTDDVVDASAFTTGLVVDTEFGGTGGGNDTITTGAGADTVLLNDGVSTITLNAGNDTVIAQGAELTTADVIRGGAGSDMILLDVRGVGNTAVDADVNLANVTGIEMYAFLGNGMTDNAATAANENVGQTNSLSFTGGSVTSVTPINVDTSAVTDVRDTNEIVITAGVTDNDYLFNVTGGASTTILRKENLGVDNDINFMGGSGVDILEINGDDAGSTVDFDGMGGRDILRVTGGTLEDDGFLGLDNVEIVELTEAALSATLGNRAELAGIDTVRGSAGNDDVTIGAGFDSDLTIVSNGGDDILDASEASGDITFDFGLAGGLTALDTVIGGEGSDTVLLTFDQDATADLENVSFVETIRLRSDNTVGAGGAVVANDSGTVNVDGTGLLAADFTGPLAIDASALAVGESLNFDGQGATVAFNVTGSGNADTLVGGAAADVINGGGGADFINGNNGNDSINGGAGNDVIRGGNGADVLTGGEGADVFYYDDQGQSFGATNRDSITDLGATDRIFIDLDGDEIADDVEFIGNVNSFEDVESSITGGDGVIEAIFLRDGDGTGGTLYIDVDDDGDISGADIQIRIENAVSFNEANLADAGAALPASGAPAPAPAAVVVAEGLDVMVSPFEDMSGSMFG